MLNFIYSPDPLEEVIAYKYTVKREKFQSSRQLVNPIFTSKPYQICPIYQDSLKP